MQDILERAHSYREHVLYLGTGHYWAGKRAARRHIAFGVPVVISTAVVSTSIFATIEKQPAVGWRIAAGLISVLAVVLSALQTFFKYSEIAENHKAAGAEYGKLRRRVDIFLLKYGNPSDQPRAEALSELSGIADAIGNMARDSPDLPDKFYDAAVERYAKA